MVTIFGFLHIAKDPVNPVTDSICDVSGCGGPLYNDPSVVGGLHCDKCGKKFDKLPAKPPP